ncbi:MAG: DUF3105 domain-containing protein [Solirubrobacterales bacterium]
MASRKEEKERLRQARLEQEAAAQSRKDNQAKARKIAAVAGVVALVIAGVVGGVVALSGGEDSMKPKQGVASGGWPAGSVPAAVLAIDEGDELELENAAKAAKCELRTDPDEGREHKDPDGTTFKYTANPPTSGDHDPIPADDNAYKNDEAPKAANLVHSLEHGRVIFQWDKDKVTDEQIGSIKKLYDDETYHLTITPNDTDMPYTVAATAWNKSMVCSEYNDETLKALRLFHLNRLDQAPENVP